MINGTGHVQYGNNIKGTITPAGTTNLTDTSLYLKGSQRPYCMNAGYNWPAIGMPQPYNTGSIQAKERFSVSQFAPCYCVTVSPTGIKESNKETSAIIYPNPAGNRLYVNSEEEIMELAIYTVDGKLIKKQICNSVNPEADISALAGGVYLVLVKTQYSSVTYRLVKTN